MSSNTPIDAAYIRSQGQAGLLGFCLMAVVAEGERGRIYLPVDEVQLNASQCSQPEWKPDVEFFQQALGFRIGNYGLTKWSDLFTTRQLTVLTAFSDLIGTVHRRVESDALSAGIKDAHTPPECDSLVATAYANAVSIYLAMCVSRLANRCSALCFWDNTGEKVQQVFARQALTMIFDTVEANPFSNSSGNYLGQQEYLVRVLEHALPASGTGVAIHAAAQRQSISSGKTIASDPPYYDNIGYADLSDFFYVWLRHSLRPFDPELFSSMSTPKAEELVATPHRHGSRDSAEKFFLSGMRDALEKLRRDSHPASLLTIFYAFRQSETDSGEGTSSTGWETFLQGVLDAGLTIVGTWPVRTEYTGNLKGKRNALASSIVLVCQPRSVNTDAISRRQFIRELDTALPLALDAMTRRDESEHSPVAPVDLSQAIIGPGMAIFSKYAAVLEADGSPMTVRTALQLINRFLAEDDFDHDTQFCLHWFEQYGWESGKFGEADVLARAKGTSVEGVKSSGVLFASGGVVRLLKWSEYPTDWDPENDNRLPIWEVLHQLIRVLRSFGESGAGSLLAHVQNKAEATRQLAYRLYTLCERANMAEDARAYNELVTSWSSIETAMTRRPTDTQLRLFDE